ncbi:ZIP family metal transporter, partial [Halorubrum sp. SS5]
EEGTLSAVMIGVFLGGIVLLGGNYAIPHLHARYREWLPEGGATGDDVESMRTAEGGRPTAGDDDENAVDEAAADPAESDAAAREVTLRKALLIGGA